MPVSDARDFYGNVPLFYAVMRNNVKGLGVFGTGKSQFHVRNYKQESLFHLAAKHNSVIALEALVGRASFFEELLKKDFKGDTPMHLAAKGGALEVLRFFMCAATPAFLTIQNDFGLTPLEAA